MSNPNTTSPMSPLVDTVFTNSLRKIASYQLRGFTNTADRQIKILAKRANRDISVVRKAVEDYRTANDL